MSVDDAVAAVVPIVVYWAYSGVHMALAHARVMDKYRLNTKTEEETKNMVSKRAVLANVLMQHAMQLAAVALLTVVRSSIPFSPPAPAFRHVVVLVSY